jgi:structural maintenance of chromosome 4
MLHTFNLLNLGDSTPCNVLIVVDLSYVLYQATRIAYGPSVEFRRVVSLEGAVFERSGTMSGGGGKPRGGRMGTAIQDSSDSQESLAAVEKELDTVKHELVSIRHRISIAIQEYRTADNALSQLALDIPKMQMEVGQNFWMSFDIMTGNEKS